MSALDSYHRETRGDLGADSGRHGFSARPLTRHRFA